MRSKKFGFIYMDEFNISSLEVLIDSTSGSFLYLWRFNIPLVILDRFERMLRKLLVMLRRRLPLSLFAYSNGFIDRERKRNRKESNDKIMEGERENEKRCNE